MLLIDSVRRALGVRRERVVPPPGPKPRLGAKIVKDDLRIVVQAGLAEPTWAWLVAEGWREDNYPNNRRRYRDVPPSRVTELFDATDADERAELMQLAASEAATRPVVRLRRR